MSPSGIDDWRPLVDCIVAVETDPSAEELRTVNQGLDYYNDAYAPPFDFRKVSVLLRDGKGQVVGGLLGNTEWGWLHVGALWIRDDVRRQGYGSALLQAAEQEALNRGCHHVFLDTTSFQALPFYLKHRYTVWGELDDFPKGHKRYFVQKALSGR